MDAMTRITLLLSPPKKTYYLARLLELFGKIKFKYLNKLHLHRTWVNSEDLNSLLIKAKETFANFAFLR